MSINILKKITNDSITKSSNCAVMDSHRYELFCCLGKPRTQPTLSEKYDVMVKRTNNTSAICVQNFNQSL